MHIFLALAAGILFGIGLALSGMADPARVQAFLDIFGSWDPTLAFVMGGAIIPMVVAWRIKDRMHAPIAQSDFNIPTSQTIDSHLILGSIIFGMGWAISGFCPGPAIANLGLNPWPAMAFITAMFVGMFLKEISKININEKKRI